MTRLDSPQLHLVIELVRATDSVDFIRLKPEGWNCYLMRDPAGGGGYTQGALFWDESMQGDLSATADLAAAGAAVERLTAIMRAFIAGAGWADIAARLAQARAAGRAVVLTMRAAAHELYTLPWEFLDVGGAPLCETDDCLLFYECPDPDPPDHVVAPAPPPESGRILLAWSAAGGGVPAAEHIDAVAAAARDGHVPFDRQRDVLANVSARDLEAALATSRPPVTILHLLCHGEEVADSGAYGLRLCGEPGLVLPERIRALLAPYRDSLRLVVVAACMGSNPGAVDNTLGSVAQAIHQAGVPAVIASRYPLTPAGSVLLTRLLYQRLLVDLCPLGRAFLDVRTALRRRDRGPDEPYDLDWAALQIFGRAALGLDFRPWIIRPYRGLKAYEREHWRIFFGRDDERRLLCRRMRQIIARRTPRFLLVAGASGTGKSSLIRAGVANDLADGCTEDTESAGLTWTTVIVRPGEGGDPSELVAARLHQHRRARAHKPGARAMIALVVDQLEELFTQITDQRRREAFLRGLWRLAGDRAGDVFVIATMRIEYMGRLGHVLMDDTGVPFDRALFAGRRCYLVRQLGPEQYERIIRGPAEVAGVGIESGLLTKLMSALRAEPGALPLLSYTLDQLWHRRGFSTQAIPCDGPSGVSCTIPVTGWWLTDQAYDELGGIAGALATTAEALFARLGPAHQDELRRVLVQLVHHHEDPMLATRRRGWRLDMRPDADADPEAARIYDEVVDALVDARLLVAGAAEEPNAPAWIELAHDSLIRFWPRFARWYQDAQAWLEHTDELRDMADAWRPHARSARVAGEASQQDDAPGRRGDPGAALAARAREEPYLLRGQRLGYHLGMWRRYQHHLGAQDRRLVQAFLDACAHAEAERVAEVRERARARRRGARLIAASAAAVAAVMTVLALWARDRQREADHQRTLAQDREIAARDAALMAGARELIARGRPAWATLLLGEVARPFSVRGWLPLAWDRMTSGLLVSTLRGHEGVVSYAVFSPDGTRVVTASDDRTARVWRADGRGQPVILSGHQGAVTSVAFNPDGTHVATASDDGTARIWRADGRGQPVILSGHEDEISSVAYSPDGTRIVTASHDGTARVWRADGRGQPVILAGHEWRGMLLPLHSAAYSPDGTRIVTTSPDDVQIWRADGQGPPRILSMTDGGSPLAATFSGDGAFVIASSSFTAAHVWRADGTGEPTILGEHEAAVASAVFSPDGTRAVTGSLDGTAHLWYGAPSPAILSDHGDAVSSVRFSPDGELVVTTSSDNTARVWDSEIWMPGNQVIVPLLQVLQGHESDVYSAEFSRDGTHLVTASADGTARVWRIDDPASKSLAGDYHDVPVFSPDGALMAIPEQQVVRLVLADSLEQLTPLIGHETNIGSIVFSPDGRRVVTTSSDDTALLWRIHDHQVTPLAGHTSRVNSAAFSPDGRLIVTTSADRTARLWHVDAPHQDRILEGHDEEVTSAAFSPDGRLVATVSEQTVRLWPVDGSAGPRILHAGQGPFRSAAFSPDGELVLTVSGNGTATLWPIVGAAEPTILRDHEAALRSAEFSPDGELVLTASRDGTARLWRVDDPGQATVLEGHEGPVHSARFSRDGTLIVTASEDDAARVWRVDDPSAFLTLRRPAPVRITAAELSPDGKRVFTAWNDGVMRLWTIDIETLPERLRQTITDCLPPSLRQDYLGETAGDAWQRYEACERSYGRAPFHPEAGQSRAH